MLHLYQQCVMRFISSLFNKGWMFLIVFFFSDISLTNCILFFKICISLTNSGFEHLLMCYLLICISSSMRKLPVHIIIFPFFSVACLSCSHFTLQLKWSMKELGLQPNPLTSVLGISPLGPLPEL